MFNLIELRKGDKEFINKISRSWKEAEMRIFSFRNFVHIPKTLDKEIRSISFCWCEWRGMRSIKSLDLKFESFVKVLLSIDKLSIESIWKTNGWINNFNFFKGLKIETIKLLKKLFSDFFLWKILLWKFQQILVKVLHKLLTYYK